jgi:hypothetical protein
MIREANFTFIYSIIPHRTLLCRTLVVNNDIAKTLHVCFTMVSDYTLVDPKKMQCITFCKTLIKIAMIREANFTLLALLSDSINSRVQFWQEV